MTRSFHDELTGLLDEANDSMVAIRRDLHAHPELAFEEHRTTKVVRDRLESLGWELARCPTDTGAVAVLKGGLAGKRVMVRADIDALPVLEERALSYASVNEGVMHACGHDVHTAALLGVAEVLSKRQADLAGEYTLLFQPAEEGGGGARAMIEGGVLDEHPVDFVIGAHVTSLAPVGLVGTRPGILMSDARALVVDILGKGGHGAMASADGNVVLAVSELAPRLGEIVTGLNYEGTNCACSAGVIHAGSANNVVPRNAQLKGTLRTFTPQQRTEALERLARVLAEIEAKFSVRCTLELGEATPAVNNDPAVAQRVLESASRQVGAANVLSFPPASPSDDVSEFLNRIPGCYMFVGGAMADGSSGMHHSPDFSVDDASCRVVAGVLAECAVDLAQG
ncbi:MAG: M20 family metallopeptidase [Acidimicrobiales bacterium]|jgi:amidohydrolase